MTQHVPLQVWYGGKLAQDVNVSRLVAFVGQNDVHLPLVGLLVSLSPGVVVDAHVHVV